jgi:hypothetical protein
VGLTIAGASGILLYILAWIVIPEARKGEEPAPTRTDSAKTVQVIVGFTLIAIGGALLVDRFVPGLQRVVWPSILILIGAAILLGGGRR